MLALAERVAADEAAAEAELTDDAASDDTF